MSKCCGNKHTKATRPVPADPCCPPTVACGRKAGEKAQADSPLAHFDHMIEHCLEYAQEARANGRPIVGIMCEYTPRELILAAGGVPVCLCGGSAETIPPAEEHLPANLCPLIKSTFGYHLTGGNPFLEMASLIVAETTCDGKKKMYELMAQSRPMFVLELPQKPDDADAFAHWRRELVKLRGELERRFGTRVTDGRLRKAIRLMNRERSLRRRLAELMQADRPALTGRQLLCLKSSISGIEADLRQYERALEALSAGAGGQPPQPAGRPAVRVLMTGVPQAHGAERVLEIVEQAGGLVVCMENCTGVKPILEDVDESAADPLTAIAAKYFHLPCSVMTRNDRRLESLRSLTKQYRPQCVIELVWQACLTYDVEAARVERFVKDELRLPYLRICTDYSPADSARIAVRVEALYETVRARPGIRPAPKRRTGLRG